MSANVTNTKWMSHEIFPFWAFCKNELKKIWSHWGEPLIQLNPAELSSAGPMSPWPVWPPRGILFANVALTLQTAPPMPVSKGHSAE